MRACFAVVAGPREIEQRERPNMQRLPQPKVATPIRRALSLTYRKGHLPRSGRHLWHAASYPSGGLSVGANGARSKVCKISKSQHEKLVAPGLWRLLSGSRHTGTSSGVLSAQPPLPARPHIIISATPAMAPTNPITQRTSPPAYLPKSAYTDSTIGVTHPVLSGLGGAGILPA